jgi:hypothetical protein
MPEFPCPSCGARCFANEVNCPTCGVNLNEAAAEADRLVPPAKYPALRAIATAYQIFAAAVGIATAIAVAIALSQSALIALLCLVVGVGAVISLLAIAEGIKVFVDIEENTRNIIARLDARDGDDAG